MPHFSVSGTDRHPPLALISADPTVLVARTDSPWNSVKDLISATMAKRDRESCPPKGAATMELKTPTPLKSEHQALYAEINQAANEIVLMESMSASEHETVDYCREQLAVYKAPARVAFVREPPKSAAGKILKRVLRQQ